MNIGTSVTVFREDLVDNNISFGDISLDKLKMSASSPSIIGADFVIFVEQSNMDTKILKNRYGFKGVVVPKPS